MDKIHLKLLRQQVNILWKDYTVFRSEHPNSNEVKKIKSQYLNKLCKKYDS